MPLTLQEENLDFMAKTKEEVPQERKVTTLTSPDNIFADSTETEKIPHSLITRTVSFSASSTYGS